VSAQSSCAGAKTYNLSGAGPGAYTFTVEATDAAGNKSPARAARYVLAAAPAKGSGSGGSGSGSAGGNGAGGLDSGGGANGGDGPTGAGSGAASDAPGAAGSGQPTAGAGSRSPATSRGARTGQPGDDRPRGSSTAADRAGATGGARNGNDTGAGAGSGGAATADGTGTGAASGSPAERADDEVGARGDRGLPDKAKGAVGDAARETAKALTGDVGKAVFPMSLLIVLGAFLLVQGRIDRGDPKLAMAPIDAEPALPFEPPPTRR
jgi:hypothetical protein